MKKPKDRAGELILKFLRTENLLESRKTSHLEYLNKNFSKFEAQSVICIDQLEQLISASPQTVIDLSKNLLSKDERFASMLKLGRISRNENQTPIDKVEILSQSYEIVSLLQLGAHLISGRRQPLLDTPDQLRILSQFSTLGVSTIDIENFRKVRNSSSHLLKLQKDEIVFPDGNSISVEQVEGLYNKINEIFSWWLTLITTSAWFIPKFGILSLYGMITHIQINGQNIQDFKQSYETFFPDIVEHNKKSKNKKKKLAIRMRIKNIFLKLKYKTLRILPFSKRDGIPPLVKANFSEVNSLLKKHSREISNYFGNEKDKLTNAEDIDRFNKIETFFGKGEGLLDRVMNEYKRVGNAIFKDV